MQTASTSMVDRDKLIEQAADQIERNLTLIGATAIEDRLQDKVLRYFVFLLGPFTATLLMYVQPSLNSFLLPLKERVPRF